MTPEDAALLLAEATMRQVFNVYDADPSKSEPIQYRQTAGIASVDWGFDQRVKLSFSTFEGGIRIRLLDASHPNRSMWSGVFTKASHEEVEDLISALQKLVLR